MQPHTQMNVMHCEIRHISISTRISSLRYSRTSVGWDQKDQPTHPTYISVLWPPVNRDKSCSFADALTQLSITIWPTTQTHSNTHTRLFFLLLTHQLWEQSVYLLPNIVTLTRITSPVSTYNIMHDQCILLIQIADTSIFNMMNYKQIIMYVFFRCRCFVQSQSWFEPEF